MSPAFSLRGSHSSPHPNGICRPASWRLTAFSSPRISPVLLSPSCVQGGELGGGRRLFQTAILLCYGSALLTRPPGCRVFLGDCCGSGGSFWAWPTSHRWKQGGSYLCSSDLASSSKQRVIWASQSTPFPPGSQPRPTRFYLIISWPC